MRRIGVPLAMLVSAAGTGAPAFAGTAKTEHSSRRAAGRHHHQRILRLHSTGPDVVALQRMLGVPADGVFGHQTLHAVRRFQHESGLLVDGQVGPLTRAALQRQNRGRPDERILEVGSDGAAVAAVQRRLEIPADGILGPVTLAAVKAFQRHPRPGRRRPGRPIHDGRPARRRPLAGAAIAHDCLIASP